ncbi:hypothetical protein P154DRAFT_429638, partial [Amniculicola lignicola CBS 123094]
FIVHDAIICEQSPFFAKALKKEWEEGTARVIPFPEDEPKVFSQYLSTAYTTYFAPMSTVPVHLEHTSECYITTAKLYVLAGKLMDHKATALILMALLKLLDAAHPGGSILPPPVDAINIIYCGTMAKDPARKALVKGFADHGDRDYSKELSESSGNIHEDFLFDLSTSLLQSRSVPTAAIRGRKRKANDG